MKRVEEWMINWFVSYSKMTEKQVQENMNKNYVEEGLVDSFGFIQLMSDIENEFRVEFSDDDFEKGDILILNDLIEIIGERI